jgi:multidrug resistance efflux pump
VEELLLVLDRRRLRRKVEEIERHLVYVERQLRELRRQVGSIELQQTLRSQVQEPPCPTEKPS